MKVTYLIIITNTSNSPIPNIIVTYKYCLIKGCFKIGTRDRLLWTRQWTLGDKQLIKKNFALRCLCLSFWYQGDEICAALKNYLHVYNIILGWVFMCIHECIYVCVCAFVCFIFLRSSDISEEVLKITYDNFNLSNNLYRPPGTN
jgi:hypothetical protein